MHATPIIVPMSISTAAMTLGGPRPMKPGIWGSPSRSVRGGDPRPRMLAAGADQHFDSPLALRTLLGGRITHEPICTERTRLDPVRGHPRLNQRVTNGRDPALAERQIVMIAALHIGVAGEPEPQHRAALLIRSTVCRVLSNIARHLCRRAHHR